MHKLSLLPAIVVSIVVGSPSLASGQDVVLKNATVIDVEAGETRPRQTLLLRNGWIENVAGDADAADPEGATIVDLAGKYVMPGLWDMHLHPHSESDLEQLVANGVTGGRIMAGEARHLAWRARIELGELVGPRLVIAGPIIEGRPPPGMESVIVTEDRRLLSTRNEAAAEARAEKAAGFDYLKVYNNLPAAAYAGLIAEGGRLGMPVIGHVPFEVGLRGVLDAGQASIEHLRGYVKLLVPEDAPVQPGADLRSRTLAWEYADLDRLPPLVAASRAADVAQCPTLSVRLLTSPGMNVARYLSAPEAAWLDSWQRAMLQDRSQTKWLSNFNEEDWQRASRGHAKQDAVLLALHGAGVPVLAGTDIGPWGFTLHGELERLVQAGLTPQQTLLTATSNPARFAGMANYAGRIAAGHQADLLILEANPLDDIRNTRRIAAVVTRGNYLDRAELDAMLAATKARIVEGTAAPDTP